MEWNICKSCKCYTCHHNRHHENKKYSRKGTCLGCGWCYMNKRHGVRETCATYNGIGGIVEMIKQVAVDDRTRNIIAGNFYKLCVLEYDEEFQLLEGDKGVESLVKELSQYDFSEESMKSLSELIGAFVMGLSCDGIEELKETLAAAQDEVRRLTEELDLMKNKLAKTKKGKTAAKVESVYESDIEDLDRFVTLYNAGKDVDFLSVEFFRSKAVVNATIQKLRKSGKIS